MTNERDELRWNLESLRGLLDLAEHAELDADALERAARARALLARVLTLADAGRAHEAARLALVAAHEASVLAGPWRDDVTLRAAQARRGRAKGEGKSAKLKSERDAEIRRKARPRLAAGEKSEAIAADLAPRYKLSAERVRKLMRGPSKPRNRGRIPASAHDSDPGDADDPPDT